jgi:hypothetical protein
VVRTLCRKGWVYEEAEDAQTVVDGDEHHILGAPLLTVKLWLRAEAFTIATAMNPQGDRQLLTYLARGFGPHVQIETVLAEGCFLAITPFSIVTTSILDGLIAGATKGVANLYALPRLNGLWFLPAVLLDGRCSIGDATIDKYIRMVIGQYTLYLTTLNR